MIDLTLANEWQFKCPETGFVYPWYTKPFLDILTTWDLKGKRVFEYGLGASTLWWEAKGAKVFGVDSNREWFEAVWNASAVRWPVNRAAIYHIEDKDFYISFPAQVGQWDIIVVDGDWRDECAQAAYRHLKTQWKGGILIIDNWLQPSVWVASEETQKLLGEPTGCYKQPGHPDWQTAYWEIK